MSVHGPRSGSGSRATGKFLPVVLPLVLAAAVNAGWPPPGVPSGVAPWEVGKYKGYPHGTVRKPAAPPPAVVTRSPSNYTLQVTVLPYKHEYEQRDGVVVMAHVPDEAQIFFDGNPTKQRGMLRQFISGPLDPKYAYTYMVRVVWPEEGEWVAQEHRFPVRPGEVHCIDVIHAGSKELEKDITAALAKLPPQDRQLAEAQKVCAVQEGIRLGSMGRPVKIDLMGKPVFLCCAACEDAARRNPDKTLEGVEKRRAQDK